MDTYRNDVTAQGSALVLTAQDLFYRLLGVYDARVRHTVGVVRPTLRAEPGLGRLEVAERRGELLGGHGGGRDREPERR